MADIYHHRFPIVDRSSSSVVKSDIRALIRDVGFSAHRAAEVDIIVSELASNLTKHTRNQGGELLVACCDTGGRKGVEIICIDNGPGMLTSMMMEDGISTSNTLGHGLGSIRRLSDDFDVYSRPSWGTILLSRVFTDGPTENPKPRQQLKISTLSIPKRGETVSGDSWSVRQLKGMTQVAIVDGLGHGQDANVAAKAVVESFEKSAFEEPNFILREIHRDVRKTRGAVCAIVTVDPSAKKLHFSGVGNIMVKLYSGDISHNFLSYNGIVGHNIPNTINTHSYTCDTRCMLVMSSDGLTSRWDIEKYENIMQHDRSILCAALYKDCSRDRDDVLIVIIEPNKAGHENTRR